jgi:hypothetical protein
MNIRGRPKKLLALAATALSATVLVLASAGTATAAWVTVPAPTGNTWFEAMPGDTVKAGYNFKWIEGSSTVIKSGSAVLSVACVDGSTPTQSTFTIPMPFQEYMDPAPHSGDGGPTGTQWVPTADPAGSSGYQGSSVLGDYCDGGAMTIGKQSATFSADVYADTTERIHFRWHFAPAADLTAPWSGTAWVVGDPLAEVPMAEGLGQWTPIARTVLFAGTAGTAFYVVRRRRNNGVVQA